METIKDVAARWAVRVNEGSLSPALKSELDAWLAADPRHLGAYVRARAQWENLDRLSALHGPATAESPRTAAAPVAPPNARGPAVSRRSFLAASAAAASVLGGGLIWTAFRAGRSSYVSGIGEVRRISLADGSTMILNTATEVSVRLSEKWREIRLLRGEALFDVAHDKTRPFVVSVNDTTVRAVGTAFVVRLEAAEVDVTVTEGVVEVMDRQTARESAPRVAVGSSERARRVKANERAIIAREHVPEIAPIALAEANRRLAWREGMVDFDGESLATAVNEINRHNHRQIVIDDPLLAQRPIVGTFRATDLDSFAAAATASLKARAVHDGDVIRLMSAASQATN